MAEARQVKNRIVQAVLRECQKLKEKMILQMSLNMLEI